MYRKLFSYMIIFAGLLLFFIVLALVLFDQYKNVRKDYVKSLDIQVSMLDKEIKGYFDKSAISAMHLSQDTSDILEEILDEEKISFEDLRDNQKLLNQIQDRIFENLKSSMFYADTSGAFVLFNTTVNSKNKGAKDSRSGLYLKLDSRSLKESSVTVYRGDADVAKKHSAMPHRKWKLEYDLSNLPAYALLAKNVNKSIYDSYRMTKVFTLPGTSEKVMLISLPITSRDGKLYGVCGFEVEEMYFKEKIAQPSKMKRLSSVFLPVADSKIDTEKALSSGTQEGYYFLPNDILEIKDHGRDLKEFVGSKSKYIGLLREVSLIANGDKSLIISMVPLDEYNRDIFKNISNIAISVVLFLFFAIVISWNFTRRYISPITDGLSLIENQEKILDEDYRQDILDSGFYEINKFLENVREKIKDRPIKGLPPYLEYKFKKFIEATSSLTPAELNVLVLLIKGYDVDQLPEILYISKSTAKHHILKIYKKLNVSSRGELLLYLDFIKGCGMVDQIIGNVNEEKDQVNEKIE